MMKAAVSMYDYWNGTPPEKIASRKLVDPISAIVCAAMLPLYEEGSKIGIAAHKVVVQEPSPYRLNIFGWKPSIRWISREYYCHDKDDLEVFKFNTIKLAHLHNPVNDEAIATLFKYAFKGIEYATKAYEKSIAGSAVITYKACINYALLGKLSDNKEISNLEERIKNLWSNKDIKLINQQIETALESKEAGNDCTPYIQSIQITLDGKAESFSKIITLYKEDPDFKEYIKEDDSILILK